MITIAIANRKGGVDKTTVSIAIATWLAGHGQTVLAVDLDSQANLTEALNFRPRPGVFKWLGADETPEVNTLGSLHLLAGNARTERVNLILSSEGDRRAIHRSLRRLRKSYQYVILDCPPSLSMLTRAAIYAADLVLIPTVPEYLSVAGVRQMIDLLTETREQFDRQVQLLGILPNKYDRRTNEHRANLTDMVRAYGAWNPNGGTGRVWPPLRQIIAITEASAEGVPLWSKLSGKVKEEWEAMVERVARYG